MDLSNLRKLRSEKGLLQKDIAKYLGISVAAYSLYENSKRTPTVDILKKLCEFYDVDIELLLGWRDPRQTRIIIDNRFEDKTQENTLSYENSHSYASSAKELDKHLEQLEKQKEEAAKNAPKLVAYDENGNEIKDRPVKFTDKSMSFEEALAEAEAEELERIQTAYKRLNRKGKAKAVERVEELTEISRYTKEDPPRDPFFTLSKNKKRR